MRKCREVPLTILAAAALLAVGCHDEQERRDCVDANNRIVPDDRCRADSPGRITIYTAAAVVDEWATWWWVAVRYRV